MNKKSPSPGYCRRPSRQGRSARLRDTVGVSVLLSVLFLAQPSPSAAQTASDNYVRSTVMLDSTGTHRRVSVDYYDAAGRPVQRVGESPVSGSTLNTGILYDALGRVSEETLPAAVGQTGHGRVTDEALGGILSSQYGDPSARTLLSYDALGRETSRRGPGAAWDQHPRATSYGTNTADEVSRLVVSGGMIYRSGCHAAGSLARETRTDEDGRMVITYTDLAGNVVMERRGTAGSLVTTRYLYDGRDRLRYVLPCAALDGMTGSGPWDAATPSIDQYAYVYEYDGHGRVTGRKLPGCAMRHTWYDRHGREAFEDDGNLAAAGRRRFFLYDDCNRLVVSGTCKASTAPDLTWREAKAWLFSGSNTYSGYRTDVVLDSVELHQINYYDNYTYIGFGLGNEGQWLSFTPTDDAASAATAKGLLTGNRTYRLGSTECEASAFYYDAKGRMVQRRSRSPLLGREVEHTTYTFTGKPVSRRHILTPPSGMEIDESYAYAYDDRTEDLLTVTHSVNRSTPVMIARYTYDALGRVATKVTGGLETTSYDYNVRSWPTKIQGQRFLEVLAYEGTSWGITPSAPQWSGKVSAMLWTGSSVTDYRGYRFTYDGMGRLTAANYRTGSSLGTNAQTFNENLTYDAMGNVTSLKRRGPKDSGAGLIDDLTMTYDGNRLIKCDDAVASQPTYNAAHHFQDLADSAVEYEYDGNGNMTKDLNREITSIEYNSLSLPRQITFSDDTKMKLTYDAAGNKLRAEYWTIPTFNPGGPIGPVGIGGGDEPMGGGIVGPILPPINQNDPQVVTDYCGNLIYRNDTLTMLLMEEGYVTFATSGTPTYHYYLKDHLGSVRIVMSQDGTVEQRNQYYPDGTLFGKQSTGGTVQPYKFGGKELERTLPFDEYDFGARWMDPTVGARFTTMDPLCEKYYSVSPYAYCGGDPVNAVDPDGKEGVKYVDEDGNKHIEANVVVLLKKHKEIKESFSEKKKARIRKKNERIDRYNASRVEMVKKALDKIYGGTNGVSNSHGEKVYFTFNVKGIEYDNPRLEDRNTAIDIGIQYGLSANTPNRFAGAWGHGIAIAVVFSQASSHGSLGMAEGPLVRVNDINNFPTALGHEIGHTFGLSDRDSSEWYGGSLMNYPAGVLTGEEVDMIWNNAFNRE